jgi:hypothetical protein
MCDFAARHFIEQAHASTKITGEPMKFLTLADWTGMVET